MALAEAKAALATFKRGVKDRCGLELQEDKTELFSNRELSEETEGGRWDTVGTVGQCGQWERERGGGGGGGAR